MNIKRVLYTLGQIIRLEGVVMVLPLVAAMCYGEAKTAVSFMVTIVGAIVLGTIMIASTRRADATIYAREGFVIVALAWIFVAAIGAIPFVLSGDIPHYVDAFFETVSGLTTTGSSILTDVEAMSRGCLFWRSFTHWIGGMGVLVLMMAIIPDANGRAIHIMRAEMPGPIVDKIVPRARETAKILYLIYLFMTGMEVLFLLFGGMGIYDALLLSFGTAGTGGFSVLGDSLASYSAYHQWVIGIFMLLFGVNFNLYYFILLKKVRHALRSEELWVFLGIVLVATGLIAGNIYELCGNLPDTIRYAFFQVSSIITTTGYATVDFNLWPGFSKCVLVLLMFIGGCAGSTAGGLKVSRIMVLFKSIRCELRRLVHPRAIATVRFEGKKMDERTQNGISNYLALYMLCFAVIFLIVSLEPFDLETNFTATVTCFNNVGPGFAAIGPMANFSLYTPFTKLVLSFAMLLGRLELYPLLLTFVPATWSKKK